MISDYAVLSGDAIFSRYLFSRELVLSGEGIFSGSTCFQIQMPFGQGACFWRPQARFWVIYLLLQVQVLPVLFFCFLVSVLWMDSPTISESRGNDKRNPQLLICNPKSFATSIKLKWLDIFKRTQASQGTYLNELRTKTSGHRGDYCLIYCPFT